ncbi:MAG: hypothetical protein EOS76_01210, partial [Mesorhizobium sp.]
KKDARICVKELYASLCSEREAALPAAEISHVSGASGTTITMSPTAQRMHDNHHHGHDRGVGAGETIQAPMAPLGVGQRPPPLETLTADPQPLLAGNNARAHLASSTRSRERSSRGQ